MFLMWKVGIQEQMIKKEFLKYLQGKKGGAVKSLGGTRRQRELHWAAYMLSSWEGARDNVSL